MLLIAHAISNESLLSQAEGGENSLAGGHYGGSMAKRSGSMETFRIIGCPSAHVS